MLVITPGGAPASGSERRVLDALNHQGGPGVVYANFHVTQNRRRREIDAFVMTPQGCAVIEVKGTSVPGVVESPADWPWRVDGRADAFKTSAGEANPGTQADTAAKILASVLDAAGCSAGFVSSAVILDGPRLQLAGPSDGRGTSAAGPYIDNGVTKVLLVESVPDGLSFLRGGLAAPQVLEILTALKVPAYALPAIPDLIDEGFPLSVPSGRTQGSGRFGQPTLGRTTSPAGLGWSRWVEGPWTWGMKARALLMVFVAFSVVNDWLGDSQGSVEPTYRGTWVETVSDDWRALTQGLDDYTTVAFLVIPATLFWRSRWRLSTSALRGFYLAQLALVLVVAASPLSSGSSVRDPETALSVTAFTTAAPFVFWTVFVVASVAPVLLSASKRRRVHQTAASATTGRPDGSPPHTT